MILYVLLFFLISVLNFWFGFYVYIFLLFVVGLMLLKNVPQYSGLEVSAQAVTPKMRQFVIVFAPCFCFSCLLYYFNKNGYAYLSKGFFSFILSAPCIYSGVEYLIMASAKLTFINLMAASVLALPFLHNDIKDRFLVSFSNSSILKMNVVRFFLYFFCVFLFFFSFFEIPVCYLNIYPNSNPSSIRGVVFESNAYSVFHPIFMSFILSVIFVGFVNVFYSKLIK